MNRQWAVATAIALGVLASLLVNWALREREWVSAGPPRQLALDPGQRSPAAPVTESPPILAGKVVARDVRTPRRIAVEYGNLCAALCKSPSRCFTEP